MDQQIFRADEACLVFEYPTTTRDADVLIPHIKTRLAKCGISVETFWVLTGSPDFEGTERGRTLPISQIPLVRPLDAEEILGGGVACRLDDMRVVDGAIAPAPGAKTRPLSSFRTVLMVQETASSQTRLLAFAAHAFRPTLRDRAPDVYTVNWVHRRPPAPVSLPRICEAGFDAAYLFRLNAFWNTAPLVMSEIARLRGLVDGRGLPVGVFFIQALFRVREDGRVPKEVHYDTASELRYFGMVDEDGQITEFGHRLLEAMHPSAHDPKFTTRFRQWAKDPEGTREASARWIRTWAGRLRRLQAKRWKQERDLPVNARKILTEAHPDAHHDHIGVMKMVRLLGSRYFRALGVSEMAACQEFHAQIFTLPKTRSPENWHEITTGFLGREPNVVGNLFWDSHVRPLTCPDAEGRAVLMSVLPALWTEGAEAALKAVRSGAVTPESVMGVPFPDAPSETDFSAEPATDYGEHPYLRGTEPPEGANPLAFYYVRDHDAHPDRGRMFAFRRGASAVWHALYAGDHLTPEGVQAAVDRAKISVRLRTLPEARRELATG